MADSSMRERRIRSNKPVASAEPASLRAGERGMAGFKGAGQAGGEEVALRLASADRRRGLPYKRFGSTTAYERERSSC